MIYIIAYLLLAIGFWTGAAMVNIHMMKTASHQATVRGMLGALVFPLVMWWIIQDYLKEESNGKV